MVLEVMARPSSQDASEMSDFALWLLRTSARKKIPLKRLHDAKVASESYLHKILKSYKPIYKYYQKPSEEKTVAIGRFLGDVEGAWSSAGYEMADLPKWLPTDQPANEAVKTEDEEAFLRLTRTDPLAAAMQLIEKAKGQPVTSPAREPVDTRSAAEKAQGVPVMAENRPTVKPEPPRGPRKDW